ncbi:hypothetical protein [Nonomuraea fuscirosea]
MTRKFVQREWYLPKEKIVIVDGFNTPGLADAIKPTVVPRSNTVWLLTL